MHRALKSAVFFRIFVHIALKHPIISRTFVHCALKNAVFSTDFALHALKSAAISRSFVHCAQERRRRSLEAGPRRPKKREGERERENKGRPCRKMARRRCASAR